VALEAVQGYNQRERAAAKREFDKNCRRGGEEGGERERERGGFSRRASRKKSEKSKPDVEDAILGFLFVFSHSPCAGFTCNVSSVRRADGYVHAKAREVGPVACEGFLHGRGLTDGMSQCMSRKCKVGIRVD